MLGTALQRRPLSFGPSNRQPAPRQRGLPHFQVRGSRRDSSFKWTSSSSSPLRLLQGQKAAAAAAAERPSDRPRPLFPAAAATAVSFSSLYPSNAPPSHSLLRSLPSFPRSSSSSFLVSSLSLLLKCELNAFSLHRSRPTDRGEERVRGKE